MFGMSLREGILMRMVRIMQMMMARLFTTVIVGF